MENLKLSDFQLTGAPSYLEIKRWAASTANPDTKAMLKVADGGTDGGRVIFLDEDMLLDLYEWLEDYLRTLKVK